MTETSGRYATGERTQAQRRDPKLEGFPTEPSWWSVAALEVFDDDTGEATPAPILQRPILDEAVEAWPERADTIQPAVANSLARWHRIDPAYVAEQLAVEHTVAEAQLADVAFRTPASGWDLAAHYLAGDVVGNTRRRRRSSHGGSTVRPQCRRSPGGATDPADCGHPY